jgi:hypothetical protein
MSVRPVKDEAREKDPPFERNFDPTSLSESEHRDEEESRRARRHSNGTTSESIVKVWVVKKRERTRS